MGAILETYLCPHPPVLLKEIGQGRESECQSTLDALENISKRIQSLKPDTVIIITPHGPVFQDALSISTQPNLKGDFSNFGYNNIKMNFKNDTHLVKNIIENFNNNSIPLVKNDNNLALQYDTTTKIDHGALVPLYFINKEYSDYNLVHITIGFLSYEDLYRAGTYIKDAVEASQNSAIVIASGDLSHKLTANAPAGYNPKAKNYDKAIVDNIKLASIEDIIYLDKSLIELAGECAHRPIVMMLGTIDAYNITTDVLSYEGPFGVGYSVATFKPISKNINGGLLDKMIIKKNDLIKSARENESDYVKLARSTLENYIKHNKVIKPSNNLPKEMLSQKSGVFVTLKIDGELRGCIGTIKPTKENTATEIIRNAIQAGTEDPRFMPVTIGELKNLTYSVDILMEAEPIENIGQLNVNTYGVIVSIGIRRGLLLPNLEGIETPKQQVSIALEKAGISPDEKYNMERFKVIRYH